MAPRRTSGSWSSSSSYTCPDAFSGEIDKANLAYYIVFLIMFIGISFAMCFVYKRSSAGKKLIGPVYILSLVFAIVSLILDFVNLIMSECGVAVPQDQDNVSIASTVLYHLSCLGLLFVVIYQLNYMLRKRLGSVVMTVRAVLLIVFGIIAALYITYIGLNSYLYSNGVYYQGDDSENILILTRKVSMAVRSLYLVCVLASTGLAAATVSSLQRAHLPGGGLMGWVFVLHSFMIIWSVLAVVLVALSFSPRHVTLGTSFALSYITTFFQALSFIALLAIARHVSWREGGAAVQQVYAPVMHEQTEYGYGHGAQAYHHEPEFVTHAK